MNTFKYFASIIVLSSVLITPVFALAADSSGVVSANLPTNLPCQAEMKAYMAKYPPQIPAQGSASGVVSGTPAPSSGTMSAVGSLPTGVADTNKDSNMNSPEGIALRDCLAKNAPSTAAGIQSLPGAPKGVAGAMTTDTSATGASTNENGCPIITRTLSRGSRGAEVTSLQTYLVAQTLLSGSATGYFGGMTVAAVKSWQTSHSISPTGTVGPKTRAALANCQGN